jgi:predicted AlkP superfamily phosphohydrolase/phosphomutase
MKRLLPLLCAVALLTASCHSGSTAAKGPQVIVLGIDGGTWTMIEPMMEKGELPNLKKLYDSGLHGILESRPPILSPVVWTTIFTGFGHQKHGIHDWKTSQSVNRKVNAIWEIVRDKNKKVDVFNVPATWPPDPVSGVMLSGFPLSGATHAGNTGEILSRGQLEGGKLSTAYKDNAIAIRDSMDALKNGEWSGWIDGKVSSRPTFRGTFRVYRMTDDTFYVTPLYRTDDGLLISEPKSFRTEITKKIGEPYIPEGPGWSRWADEHVPEVLYPHLEQVFSIQSKAALEYAGGDWDLYLYVMTFVDRISHPYWAYSHPESFPSLDPAKVKKYASAVGDAYRRSDEEIGKILAKVKGTPYVMIVSDHGFQASTDPTKAIGTHNPDGIYIVTGPGITPKTGLPKFIEDVTPTVLYLLGMPTGQDMDGKLFTEVAEMVGRPPTSIPTYEKGGRESTDEPVDGDTWESLRGLGYVDGAPPRQGDKNKNPAGKNAAGMPPGAAVPRKPPLNAQPGEPGLEPPKNALENWPEAPPHTAPSAPAHE